MQEKTLFEVKHKNRDITNKIVERAKRRFWNEKEIVILKDNYGSLVLKELHENFLPFKTVGQIRAKAYELGLTIDRRWQNMKYLHYLL